MTKTADNHKWSPDCHKQASLYGGSAECHLNACAGKDSRFGVDNVGTPAASLTTYLAAQAFQPDLAISLGTAGGFKAKGAAIGSVFIGTATVNHDRRIPLPVRIPGSSPILPSCPSPVSSNPLIATG